MGIFIKTFFMKAITMLCFCAFAIKFAPAQNKFPFQKKATPFNNITERSFTLATQQQATLIGQNAIGKIYALPADNMPCLVPHAANEALMPVYTTTLLHPGIPNPFPKQDLLASAFNKRNSLKFNAPADGEGSKNYLKDYLQKNKR
jgi:hypothetical protein